MPDGSRGQARHDHDGLGGLAEFGPFFAVASAAGGDRWRPLRGLLDGTALDERLATVRAGLSVAGAPVEVRVAASILSVGLFARLMSPVLGAVALDLPLPGPGPDTVWWQPVERGPVPLALTGPVGPPDPAGVLRELVRPIAARLARRYSLSTRILRGNAASAVFGAVGVIRSVRPDLVPPVAALAGDLLAGPLAGAGELRGRPGGSGRRFVRASCCLFYRVPGGGYCGDCVLSDRTRD